MKTTVEISDELLAEAKAIAARERTTLRALIDRGLREVLRQRYADRRFRLRDASVHGNGLRPEIADSSWSTLRSRIYEGRGA